MFIVCFFFWPTSLFYLIGCELSTSIKWFRCIIITIIIDLPQSSWRLFGFRAVCVVKLLKNVQVSDPDVFLWTQSVATDALRIKQEDWHRHRPGHPDQDARARHRGLWLAAVELLSPGRRGGILRRWPPAPQPGVWGQWRRIQTQGRRPGRRFPPESLRERDAITAVPNLLPGAREGTVK